MAKLQVALVAPDREVWSGEADMVVAKTLEGEIGILPQHAPVLASLADGGVVRVIGAAEREITAAVYKGFLSVASDRVSVLAEYAVLGSEVDVAAARRVLEQALAAGETDEAAAAEVARARAQLRAAGEEV